MWTLQMQIVGGGFFACFSMVCIQGELRAKPLFVICSVGVTGRAV